MVSILLGVLNGGGVCCCCPVQWCGVGRALLIPVQCWRVLLSCRALSVAGCVVCGWWVCVYVVRVVGYPLSAAPLTLVEGGAIVDGGVA